MTLQSLTLEGRLIRLEPLNEWHFSDLYQAARFAPGIWQYTFYGDMSERSNMKAFIVNAIRRREAGTDQPFAVIDKATDRAIGSTRYRDICTKHMNLEIGGTWYAPQYLRTGVNLESKYLLLRHAFETFGTLRVQLKTDMRNTPSRKSLEKMGASLEGILRRNGIMPDGVIRDTAVYSILDTEWGMVKQGLEARLERHAQHNHFNLHDSGLTLGDATTHSHNKH